MKNRVLKWIVCMILSVVLLCQDVVAFAAASDVSAMTQDQAQEEAPVQEPAEEPAAQEAEEESASKEAETGSSAKEEEEIEETAAADSSEEASLSEEEETSASTAEKEAAQLETESDSQLPEETTEEPEETTEESTEDSDLPCEHRYEETVVPAACTEQGYTLHICSLCGDRYEDTFTPIDSSAHSWGSWTVIKQATYEASGTEQRTCELNETHTETRTVSQLSLPLVGSARNNENQKAYGGKVGDQTGHEVETQDWYLHSKGWVVIRAKSAAVREAIARDMEYACENSNVGYGQDDDLMMFNAVKGLGFDASRLKTPVNVDCSSLVRICLWYSGIKVPLLETKVMVSVLNMTGLFRILSDEKYTTLPDYLMRGDILVTAQTPGHTVVVLGDGYKAEKSSVQIAAPVVTKQPEDLDLKDGQEANFTVSASGTGLAYRWYYRTGSDGSWKNVEESSGRTANYSFTTVFGQNGWQFRCAVIDKVGQVKYTRAATLNLKTTLGIIQQPESMTVVGEPAAAKASVTVKGDGLSYAWYRCESGGTVFAKTTVTASSYSVKVSSGNSGLRAYCIVTDRYGSSLKTNTVTFKYQASVPKITDQPNSKVAKSGAKATFKVSAKWASSYEWYYRTSSKGAWKKATGAGAKTASYTVKATAKRHGYEYRCKVTNETGSVYTSSGKLTVVTKKPTIKTQPKSKTVAAGKTEIFKVVAKGRALSYQWYRRSGSKGAWKAVSGKKSSVYSFKATKSLKGYQFRCVVKNLKGSATSKAATLKVK